MPRGWPSPTAMSTPYSPGGFQQAQGDGVDPHDHLGPCPVGGGHNGVHILQHPKVVGALDIDGGRVPGQHRLEGGGVGGATVHRQAQ